MQRREFHPFEELTYGLMQHRGRIDDAYRAAKSARGGCDPRVIAALSDGAELYQKATVAQATTSDGSWSGPLSALNSLAGDWAFATLAPMSIPDAIASSIRVAQLGRPFAVTSAVGTGSTVAEGELAPLTKFGFGAMALEAMKVKAVVVLSEETLRFTADGGKQLLRIELSNAMATASNNAALPRITDGLSLIASSGDARTDLAAALAAVPLGQISRPFVFTSPDVVKQLAFAGTDSGPTWPDITLPSGGSINGMPIMGIDACHTGGADGDLLVVVDAVQLVGFLGPFELFASGDATLVMSDTVSGSGPQNMTSLFQDNSIALSMTRYLQLEKARTNCAAAVKNVDYSVGSP